MKTKKVLAILVLGLLVSPIELVGAAPMGTAFTYQGRLVDDSSAANGQYDIQFKVFDNPDASLGIQQGSTIYINNLNVIDGYFTAELDFGRDVFTGDARWLEIGVRPGADTGSYTILSPLQEIKPTPHAIHAAHALQADDADTLNGLDSSAFAVTTHSHDGVYALISHTHSGSDITTGIVADRFIADSIARDSELTWGNLARIPIGFADGIDNIGGTDSDWTILGNDMYSNVAGNVGIGTSSPQSKLSVDGDGYFNGNVGIGTASPNGPLHVNGNVITQGKLNVGSVNTPIYPLTVYGDGIGSDLKIVASMHGAGGGIQMGYHSASTTEEKVAFIRPYSPGTGSVTTLTFFSKTNPNYWEERMRIDKDGNVGIGTTSPQGTLDVNGSIYQRGSELHADYVFDRGYKLESIDEHSEFMWQNKHLPAIPKAKVDKAGKQIVEVGAHRRGIVEELEKAHIYIEYLHKQNKALETRLVKLEAIVARLNVSQKGVE